MDVNYLIILVTLYLYDITLKIEINRIFSHSIHPYMYVPCMHACMHANTYIHAYKLHHVTVRGPRKATSPTDQPRLIKASREIDGRGTCRSFSHVCSQNPKRIFFFFFLEKGQARESILGNGRGVLMYAGCT